MIVVCSPEGIVSVGRPGQGIADIANAKFENVLLDMSMYCPADELKKEKIRSLDACEEELVRGCQERGLQLPIARAPYMLRNTKRENAMEMILRLAEESIVRCGRSGCEYVVIRPISAGFDTGNEWKVNREFYLKLAKVARDNHMTILLENQCRSLNGHMVRGICSDAMEAVEWIKELNETVGGELFGFCMDVGVCNLCGQNMQEFVSVLGKHLKAVVLRDCDGRTDNALLPFTNVSHRQVQTDWLSLIRGLREIEFDGIIILNIADMAASVSHLLRSSLLKYAKEMMNYFTWQIGMETALRKYSSIVLFGAGNMCRNYMKCYGEKYPPLFTCDNNSELWGTCISGLEVKSPEALKNLPDDCGVFICNIYYKEITQQLCQMSINNIEYFNDEYLPCISI